jgi:hypothetical protein
MALTAKGTPSVLALSPAEPARGPQEPHRAEPVGQGRLCAGRGHGKAPGDPDRHRVRGRNRAEGPRPLEAEGIGTRVVSMPSMELFAAPGRGLPPQGAARRPGARGDRGRRAQGWDRWLLGERGRDGKAAFVGMSSFRRLAPPMSGSTRSSASPPRPSGLDPGGAVIVDVGAGRDQLQRLAQFAGQDLFAGRVGARPSPCPCRPSSRSTRPRLPSPA